METKKNNIEFIPKFEKSFFTAALLGRLAGVFAFAGIALTPPSFRDPLLGKLGSSGRASGEKLAPPGAD